MDSIRFLGRAENTKKRPDRVRALSWNEGQ